MTSHPVIIDLFGDPACPWDFSAEGARLRLEWRYGARLVWRRHMVGLSRTVEEYADRGVTLADLAASRAKIRRRFGMPIDTDLPPRHMATVVACRAVVAVRVHAPDREDAFLRMLRVLGMSDHLLIDEPDTLARAAGECGVDADDLARWMRDPEVEDTLRADMALARAPSPAALAQRERLARTPEGGWRYTCPSYRINAGDLTVDAPGYQPARVYEVAIANLAPHLTPRQEPEDVEQVLAWAPYPLATAEVAVIMESRPDTIRTRLEGVARGVPAAGDHYWSLD